MRVLSPRLIRDDSDLAINIPTSAIGRLATNVRHHREQKGWSQEDLSHKSGIHPTYLSGLECGKRNPTVKILEQLAQALSVHISQLFE